MASATFLQTVYPKTVIINPVGFKSVSVSDSQKRYTEIMQVLPFRVRFTNIGIEAGGYSPINPAPIGIAIIGYNNYIL